MINFINLSMLCLFIFGLDKFYGAAVDEFVVVVF